MRVPRELLSETTSRYASQRVYWIEAGEHHLTYDFPNLWGVQVTWRDIGSRQFGYDVVLRAASEPLYPWGAGYVLCHAALSPRMVEELLLFARDLPAVVGGSIFDTWRAWKPSRAAQVEQVREGTEVAQEGVVAPQP